MLRTAALVLLACLLPQDNKKKAFLDPESAGPDFVIQGEYEGGKMGAQVVALGDRKFDVYLLGGGLPGAGWDQKTRVKIAAKTENDATSFAGKDWSGAVDGVELKARGPEGEITLKKVVRRSPTEGAKPPADAIVLFDGSSADEWQGGKLVETNLLNMGVTSKKKFGSVKLHVEFKLSFMPYGRGQGRSNSGVYLAGRHECQVLDSFGLTGENNECGGIYSIAKPAVNMCFPPLSWQTFDIEYRLPSGDKGAIMTVIHNGVKVHDAVEIKKKTTAAPDGGAETTPGPIHLQNHGDPLVYRNIWIQELK